MKRYSMADKSIPITRVDLDDKEIALVRQTILSGWVAQGPRVREFERKFADCVGAEHAVAVSSCTTGLFLCLHLLGIGPGDEVIVPSYSFIATANAVVHCGATPVFVDIDPATYNIDPEKVSEAVGPGTTAIVPVHQVGQAADLDRIYEIARARKIPVIEDAACAIGTTYRGKPVGGDCRFAAFSFHPRKLITTGEGGMITTADADIASRLRVLRQQGMSVSDLDRHRSDRVIFEQYPVVGYNFRMTDLQAALGVAQLDKLAGLLAERRRLAQRYTQVFQGSPNLMTPFVPEYSGHNFQSYLLRLAPSCPVGRNELMQKLLDRGIATRRGVMCAHLEPCYRNLGRKTDLKNSEAAAADTLVIPLFPGLSRDDQDRVSESILELTSRN